MDKKIYCVARRYGGETQILTECGSIMSWSSYRDIRDKMHCMDELKHIPKPVVFTNIQSAQLTARKYTTPDCLGFILPVELDWSNTGPDTKDETSKIQDSLKTTDKREKILFIAETINELYKMREEDCSTLRSDDPEADIIIVDIVSALISTLFRDND